MESHEKGCKPLGIDKAKYLNVLARSLAPAGDLQRWVGLGEAAMIAQRLLPAQELVVFSRHFGVGLGLFQPGLAHRGEVAVAGKALFLLELLQLALLQQPPAGRRRPGHKVEIAQYAGKLIHGQGLGRLFEIRWIAGIEIGNDQIGMVVVVNEMTPDPRVNAAWHASDYTPNRLRRLLSP